MKIEEIMSERCLAEVSNPSPAYFCHESFQWKEKVLLLNHHYLFKENIHIYSFGHKTFMKNVWFHFPTRQLSLLLATGCSWQDCNEFLQHLFYLPVCDRSDATSHWYHLALPKLQQVWQAATSAPANLLATLETLFRCKHTPLSTVIDF